MLKKTFLLFTLIMSLFIFTMFLKGGYWGIPNKKIFDIRVNKWITMAMGSFSIGFSTWILQRFTKNKIIDSSFFGVSSFNILILVFLYTFFIKSVDIGTIYKWFMPLISIFSSIVISIIISFTILKKSKYSKKNIVIVGIMLNYLFIAISYMYIKFLDPNTASSILDISIGSINEGYNFVIPLLLGILQISSVVWYFLIQKNVYVTNINETFSLRLGNNVLSIKVQQIIIAGINVAIAFSLMGSVAFLGIISCSLAKKIFKNSKFNSLFSGFITIFIAAISYFIMNCLLPTYYPIGITTSIISIPYFIYVITRRVND